MSEPRYADVVVELVGQDGNAMAIIGRVSGALRRQVGVRIANEWVAKALDSQSYDDLLRYVQETVTVC